MTFSNRTKRVLAWFSIAMAAAILFGGIIAIMVLMGRYSLLLIFVVAFAWASPESMKWLESNGFFKDRKDE